MLRTCVILFLSSLMLLACKKGNNTSPVSGKWIESKDRADTLIFDSESFLSILRGKELSSGHLLPKAWSGMYFYSIKSDSITVHYSLSSNSRQYTYVYSLQGNELTIGDFYKKNQTQGSVLKFTRLR